MDTNFIRVYDDNGAVATMLNLAQVVTIEFITAIMDGDQDYMHIKLANGEVLKCVADDNEQLGALMFPEFYE